MIDSIRTITCTCYNCKRVFEINVSAIKYGKYKNGELSQKEAFDELTLNDYELLIGGMCTDCLDGVFGVFNYKK